MGILSGEATLPLPSFSFKVSSEWKKIAPLESNSFQKRVESLFGRLRPSGKQAGSQESCFPCKYCRQNREIYLFTYIAIIIAGGHLNIMIAHEFILLTQNIK